MNALIAGHVLPSRSQEALPDVRGTTNKTTTTTVKQLMVAHIRSYAYISEKERIKTILPKFVLVPRKSYSPLRLSPLNTACAPSRTVRASCDLPIEVLPSNSTRRLRDITNTNTNTNTSIANSKSQVMITKIFVDEQRLAVKMRIRRQRKVDDEDLRRHVLLGRMAARSPPPPAPPQAEQPRGRPTTRTRLLTFPIPEKYSRRKDFGKPWAQRKAEILGENLPLAPFFGSQ